MPLVPFDELPNTARLWVFSASDVLGEEQSASLLRQVDEYLASWQAHGAPLRVGREWRYQRFLLIAVDESVAGASGCSIDGLVRCIRAAEEQLGTILTDNAPVWFKDGAEIRHVSRAQFRTLAQNGDVGPDTIVFDNTLTSLEGVRQNRWEVRARQSWHGRAFFADALARSES